MLMTAAVCHDLDHPGFNNTYAKDPSLCSPHCKATEPQATPQPAGPLLACTWVWMSLGTLGKGVAVTLMGTPVSLVASLSCWEQSE